MAKTKGRGTDSERVEVVLATLNAEDTAKARAMSNEHSEAILEAAYLLRKTQNKQAKRDASADRALAILAKAQGVTVDALKAKLAATEETEAPAEAKAA